MLKKWIQLRRTYHRDTCQISINYGYPWFEPCPDYFYLVHKLDIYSDNVMKHFDGI